MAAAKKDQNELTIAQENYIKNVTKDDEPTVDVEVPEDSLFWPIYKLLSTAHETGTAVLDANYLRRNMGRSNISKGGNAVKVRLYGFPLINPRYAPCLAVGPGITEKKYKDLKKKGHIPSSMLEYFRYFGEIIPLHLVPRKLLIFGYGSGVWCPPTKPDKILKFLEKEFWAADEEEFPSGKPAVLLGYDGQDNIWFGSEHSHYVWTFDRSIQGIRNANYYDDDDEERIFWPKYSLRLLGRWIREGLKSDKKKKK